MTAITRQTLLNVATVEVDDDHTIHIQVSTTTEAVSINLTVSEARTFATGILDAALEAEATRREDNAA